MNLLIVNQPVNNHGDESAHRALLRSLIKMFPNIRITVLFIGVTAEAINEFSVEHPNIVYKNISVIGRLLFLKFLNGGLCFKQYYLWRFHPGILKIIKYIKDTDIVLCAPGGPSMGVYRSWPHIAVLYIAKRFKKKIIYYGRSIGPFSEDTWILRRFRDICYELLDYFSFLSIRDAKSQQIVDTISVKYVRTVDTTFLDSTDVEIPNEIKTEIGNSKYLIFVPNLLVGHFDFKQIPRKKVFDFWVVLAEFLITEYSDHKIIMLPQTYGPVTKDGYIFFSEIKDAITDNERIIIIDDKYGSDIQQSIIAKAKFLIGARYHSVVFAINQNVPFISLNYEHKMQGLLDSLDKKNCSLDLTNIFDNKIKINAALKDIKRLLGIIDKDPDARDRAKSIAHECMNKLMTILQEF